VGLGAERPDDADLADVVVVGAGPTGLALAAQLIAHGIRPRIVDRSHDRVHESRALAIQPRTLEVLAGLGVTDELLAEGNRAVQLRLHVREKVIRVQLFDFGLADTEYPYLLFLSQAETERILVEHLDRAGVSVERGVEVTGLRPDGDAVVATLRRDDGGDQSVRARYVVGCDGAHSIVRRAAQIDFEGSSYPQTFVLADLEADGLEPGAAHAFLTETGLLFFFPLGTPATWRVLAMRSPTDPTPPDAPVTLRNVQAIVDASASMPVRLHDPVWMTNFRLHNRGASHYRAGPMFLAGDAAHIHSPAGAQGMNTGIQDAINLGWKLAYVLTGRANPALLDTYEPERAPIGRFVLRYTDRAFSVATSANPFVRIARTRVMPLLLPLAVRVRSGRALAFRTVSQLDVRYRRSPLAVEGEPRLRRGPRAGDRLPDAPIRAGGEPSSLHRATSAAGWHLLLCGPALEWTGVDSAVALGADDSLNVHRLSAQYGADALHDHTGLALRRLGLNPGDVGQYLVRPDGHIGYRSAGTELDGVENYLRRWIQRYGREP
jgi:2-polyprenyl-6-methoxyphenol hydroxylase-like FAD-dependent oxidoreductase